MSRAKSAYSLFTLSLIFATAIPANAQQGPEPKAAAIVPDQEQEDESHSNKPLPYPLPIIAATDPTSPEKRQQTNSHYIRAIEIPLLMLPPDLSQPDGTLWAKGDKPKNNVLAKFEVVPEKAVKITATLTDGSSGTFTLLRAHWHDTGDPKPKYPQKGEIYCGKLSNNQLAQPTNCLIDSDGDQKFDQIAFVLGDEKHDLFSSSAIFPAAQLQSPIAWQESGTDGFRMKIDLLNCAKDWDKPYYLMSRNNEDADNILKSMEDVDAWVAKYRDHPAFTDAVRVLNTYLSKGSLRTNFCRRTQEMLIPTQSLPGDFHKKGYIANMDGLVLAIDKKSSITKTRLLAQSNPKTLYRMENNQLVPLSIGHNVAHARLATGQRYDRYLLEAQNFTVAHQSARPGDELFSVDFNHGYLGELTQDVTISTLFSSRSLPAGTRLYGFAAKASTSRTINGVPVGGTDFNFFPERNIEMEFVWCVPVSDEDSKDGQKVTSWSASCLASSTGDNYTLLKGRQPPLAVSSLSFDVNTSSNSGAIPVRRIDATPENDIGKMQWRFSYHEVFDGMPVLRKDSLLDGQILHSEFFPLENLVDDDGKTRINLNAVKIELISRPGDGQSQIITIAETSDLDRTARLTEPQLLKDPARHMNMPEDIRSAFGKTMLRAHGINADRYEDWKKNRLKEKAKAAGSGE